MNQTQTTAVRDDKETIARMRLLGSFNGFFKAYFDSLPGRSNIEAFELVNNEYYEHFGEFKYRNHESFRRVLHRLIKQNKL